jgi:intein/homing endonuclease
MSHSDSVDSKNSKGFPAGTRIVTDKGLVPIQDIKVGDMVLSKPESGEGNPYYKPVVHIVSYDDKEIWELNYFEIKANTEVSKLHKGKLLQLSRKGKMSSIIATPNHPFWVNGIGWTRLDKLQNGQLIPTHDSNINALVLMVAPLRKTIMPQVAGSYHPSNVLEADRKGFDIANVECFDLFKYDEFGLCDVLGKNNSPSPVNVDGQEVHVLDEVFNQKVYNFEVADYHTFFIFKEGLWVHNTNCVDYSSTW